MKVYLIGAGPGDPGLITLKGKEVLERADVVIYDYLACPLLLDFVHEHAEKIFVGKKSGSHTMPQEDINELLIKKAKENKLVVRLKGGDPYIFGRGGEEAEALAKANVPFEVVPGVTSSSGLAYSGIPLTHRGIASSVTLVTGHDAGSEDGIKWEALAKSGGTIVFYMGLNTVQEICTKLIHHGMPAKTPAAVIRWGTTPQQQTVISTLKHLPLDVKRNEITSPALIVIGKVVRFNNQLDWFGKKPLLGKKIIVTRAREQLGEITSQLHSHGAEVVQFPTITIQPLEDYSSCRKMLGFLMSYDWLAFTSVNSVKHFWKQLFAIGSDSRALGGCKIAAIGPSTAQALKEYGITPDFIPERFVAESVVKGLLAHNVSGKRILIPRALVAREELVNRLREAGATVDVLPLYQTNTSDTHLSEIIDFIDNDLLDCVVFASSSSVDRFMGMVPAAKLKACSKLRFACIGPITSESLEKHGFRCNYQPTDYTIQELVNILVQELPLPLA